MIKEIRYLITTPNAKFFSLRIITGLTSLTSMIYRIINFRMNISACTKIALFWKMKEIYINCNTGYYSLGPHVTK